MNKRVLESFDLIDGQYLYMVVYNSVMIRYDSYGPTIGPFLEGEWVYRCTHDTNGKWLQVRCRRRCPREWSKVAAPLTRDRHLSGKGWKAPKSKAEKVFHIWINSKKKFKSNLPTILKNTVTQGGSYFVEDELVAHVTIQKLPSLGLEPEVVVWDFQLKYV